MVYDFTIVYERKFRELENAILLKIALEKRGYNVRVVNYYEASKYKLWDFNKTRVLIVPHLYSSKSVCRNFARYGKVKHMVNMQYEQVLSDKWEKLGHHNPREEALKGIHICWGNNAARRLLACGVSPKNIRLLGPLGFDLLKNENSMDIKHYLGKINNLDITKKWILFLSSFSYANIDEHTLREEENVVKTSLENIVNMHTQSRQKIIEWLETILIRNRDNLIIYRPHPSEINIEIVKYLEHKFTNFKIVNYGAVKYWIAASDKNYTWYSTSIIESYLLNKPSRILRPYKIPDDIEMHLLKGEQFIENVNDFEHSILDANVATNVKDKLSQLKDYYDLKSQKLSILRYCDELELILKNTAPENFCVSYKLRIISKMKLIPLSLLYVYFKIFKKANITIFPRWMKILDSQIANQKEKQEATERLLLFFKHTFDVL